MLATFVIVSVAILACFSPSKQELSLRQLDSDAAETINELIQLYESTTTEQEAHNNVQRLILLHDDWLENRKSAYALDLDGDVYDRSWSQYRRSHEMFDFRVRLHKSSIERRAKLFKDYSVVNLSLIHI